MKPFKHLACLVTLLSCGHPLLADTAVTANFRAWNDVYGRTTVARFVRMVDHTTVEIEHKETKLLYRVPVAKLSTADHKYLEDATRSTTASAQAAGTGGKTLLKDPDETVWALLQAAGSQPSLKTDMKFDLVLELINQRLAAREITVLGGKTLSIRSEPADLVQRVSVPRDMRRMRMDEFVNTIAALNDISVKVDSSGLIVLIDKALDEHTQDNSKPVEFDFYKTAYVGQIP